MQTSNDDERTRLLTMINGQWMTQAIAAAAGLGLPGLMARRPQTCAELAEATGSHAASLERLLHALQSIGLCVIGQGQSQGEGEGEGEAFELTPLGALLDPASPGTLHAWARMRAERWMTSRDSPTC